MAEYFTERGGHALLVLDDLTKHAQVHRQISLLLREPPGREAYPGDVFYLHSRLLERAARLIPERGGGSLTVLPIAETQAGNLSAYIPTNLISITDGQIFLEPRLFNEGIRPAIDIGKSVSRVGGRTQSPAMRSVAETLRLDYAQFLELELFTRIEGGGDEATRRALDRGRRVRAALVQPSLAPLSQGEQVALLCALEAGALDDVPPGAVGAVRRGLRRALESRGTPLLTRLDAGEAPGESDRELIVGSSASSRVERAPRDPMEASDVAARVRTVAQLDDIVQAMRTLANVQRRQAHERFSGLERYAAATRAALGDALALLDSRGDCAIAPGGPCS